MRIRQLLTLLIALMPALPAATPFSTFLRENGTVSALATDAAGNIYALGQVQDSPIPGHGVDFFVIRLDPSATRIAYYRYFGGSGNDTAVALAVDPAGNAFIAGATYSSDFPATNGSAASASETRYLPFVMKLNPAGDVVFSSIYETAAAAYAQAIALDSAGNIVLTGAAAANASYPATSGAYNNPGNAAFITKLDPSGVRTIFSIAGAGGGLLALDAQDAIYVSGNGGNASTPVTPGALQTTFTPSYICGFPCQITFPAPQPYISKLSADGSRLIYSTFLSGNQGASNEGLAVDQDGNVFVTGNSASTDFPYTGAATSDSRVGQFLAKLDSTGSRLVWSVRQGGSQLAVDANGNLAVAGYWGPVNTSVFSIGIVYPAPVPTGSTPAACLPNQLLARQNAFLQHFNPSDGSLVATQIYPASFVQPTALAATADGRVLMAGITALPDVPLTPGVVFAGSIQQRTVSGVFLAAFDQGGAPLGGSLPCVVDALGNNISGPVAGGQMLSLMGSGFGPAAPVVGSVSGPGSVPVTLGGITATFDDVPAPVFYVSDTQINLSVPFEVKFKSSTLMQLSFNGQPVAARQFAVIASNPTLVTDTSVLTDCPGTALTLYVLNEDGSKNTCTNRARPGSTVTLLLNGADVFVGTPPATGMVTGANPSIPATPVYVRTGGLSLASGPLTLWPGVIAGVYQLQVTLPATISAYSPTLGIYLNVNGLDAGPFVASGYNPTQLPGLVWVTP